VCDGSLSLLHQISDCGGIYRVLAAEDVNRLKNELNMTEKKHSLLQAEVGKMVQQLNSTPSSSSRKLNDKVQIF
jgi:hypothetical protein